MSQILVVEDESAIAELISINLRHAGFEVTIAATAEQAQAAVDGVLPDLIILDWMLPGQSGLALAKRWRGEARTRELPVIMLTARADEADKIAGPRCRRRRLPDQAVLDQRADGAHPRGAAAQGARGARFGGRGRRAEDRPGDAPRDAGAAK